MNEDDFLRCLEAAPLMGSHALLRPVNQSARPHHRLTSRSAAFRRSNDSVPFAP